MAVTGRDGRRVIVSHRRPSAVRPRHWRVRTKLAAVLVIPLVSFLVLAGVQLATAVATASNLDTDTQRVRLGRDVTKAVHELQRERDRTAGMLAALESTQPAVRDVSALAPDRTAVDQAVENLRTAVHPLLGDARLNAAYGKAQAALTEVWRVRAGVDQGWLRMQAAFDAYSLAVAELLAVLPDAQPADAVGDFAGLSRAKELLAEIRGYLFIVCSRGAFGAGEYERIADIRARAQAALDDLRASGDQADVALVDETLTGQATSNANRLLQTVIRNVNAGAIDVDAQQWWLASTTQLESLREAEQKLLGTAVAHVTTAARRQWHDTLYRSLATILLLLVTIVASGVVGRGMASTLRSLREQAMTVARHRLPHLIAELRSSPITAPSLVVDPILVHARDEVGEVADAFTAVHRSAVRLAAEQALMRRNVNEIFIRLARRSQALVERQLRLLDTMESAETDPDALAKLFRLDHLAARLRRNDENLLVLAGGNTARRTRVPVELNAVFLAATSEIDHYKRIRHEAEDGVYVVGHAATDLVHLIAELLDNAASFSPPSAQVDLAGLSKADGGARIVITDRGIGMTREAVARSNRQLAAPVSIDVSSAERMGLVVVGHLARRHGIRVRLALGDGPGITALIDLPAMLLAPAPALPVASGPPPRSADAGNSRPGMVPAPSHRPPALTAAGLPQRVRQAHVPTSPWRSPVTSHGVVDPEATQTLLTDLYGGIRRAEAEPSKG
jgi:hypothetical protein